MTTTNASFQTPPSEHDIINVIASQSRVMYLNNPKDYKEEEVLEEGKPPVEPVTAPNGENTTSDPANHDWQKRYSDLKSYMDKERNKLNAEKEALVNSVKEKEYALEQANKQAVQMPTTPEEFDAFKTKYGHLVDVMRTVAIQENTSTKAELEKAIKDANERARKLEAEKAFSTLLAIHPDAETLRSDSKFIEWVESQIPAVRRLIESDKVDEVARGIDIYKKDIGMIKESPAMKAAKQAAAARNVPTNSQVEIATGQGKIWKASEVKRMSRTEYAKHEKEVLKALAEGRYRDNE